MKKYALSVIVTIFLFSGLAVVMPQSDAAAPARIADLETDQTAFCCIPGMPPIPKPACYPDCPADKKKPDSM